MTRKAEHVHTCKAEMGAAKCAEPVADKSGLCLKHKPVLRCCWEDQWGRCREDHVRGYLYCSGHLCRAFPGTGGQCSNPIAPGYDRCNECVDEQVKKCEQYVQERRPGTSVPDRTTELSSEDRITLLRALKILERLLTGTSSA